jgi:hypothetical protein
MATGKHSLKIKTRWLEATANGWGGLVALLVLVLLVLIAALAGLFPAWTGSEFASWAARRSADMGSCSDSPS